MMLSESEIGGGTVRRTFKFGDHQVFSGKVLTAAEIVGIPKINRRALIEKGYIVVYPKPPASAQTASPGPQGERHVVSAGFGRYNVIEGTKLNPEPLDKEEAIALAGSKPKATASKKKGAKARA